MTVTLCPPLNPAGAADVLTFISACFKAKHKAGKNDQQTPCERQAKVVNI